MKRQDTKKKRDLRDEGIVRIGKKPWHVYVAAIEHGLERSNVLQVNARGRTNNAMAASVISTVIQTHKDIACSARITFEAWKGKNAEGKLEKQHGSVSTWMLEQKSSNLRIRSKEEE